MNKLFKNPLSLTLRPPMRTDWKETIRFSNASTILGAEAHRLLREMELAAEGREAENLPIDESLSLTIKALEADSDK